MHSQQQTPHTKAQSVSHWLVWVALLFATVWLATLGSRKLLNPDEGRYAEIPREMVATGDWLTPRLNDLKYFEKPPLQYWATAVAFEALGTTEFAARLWTGLTGLGGIFFVGWMGTRLFGRIAGTIAAALLASSLMYVVLGQLNTLDMGLTFFLTLAIGGFLTAQHAPEGSKNERNFMLLAWAAAALALLSKGIVAVALPVITLLVYSIVAREYSAWRRLHMVPGLLLFLLIGAPWLIAVSIANPEFAKFFFLHEHFARFFTDVHKRVEPWWYFVPLLIAGTLPWTSLAAVAVAKAWREVSSKTSDLLPAASSPKPVFNVRRFLVVWVAVVMAFFSASHSKLVPYILPVIPALALLTGDYIARARHTAIRNHLTGIAVIWAVALGYFLFGPLPHKRGIPPELFTEAFRWAAAAAAVALWSAALAWVHANRNQVRDALFTISGGTFLALTILIIQLDVARVARSSYDLAQAIKPHQTPGTPLYSLWTYDHSLAFYLERNATIVDYKGELEFGQSQEPGKSLANVDEFKRAWQRDPVGSLAVMKQDVFDVLALDDLPMTVIGRNLQLVAVKKP